MDDSLNTFSFIVELFHGYPPDCLVTDLSNSLPPNPISPSRTNPFDTGGTVVTYIAGQE